LIPPFLFNFGKKKILIGTFTGLILAAGLCLFFISVNSEKAKVFIPKRLPAAEVLDSLPISRFGFLLQGLSILPLIGKDSLGPGYYEIQAGRSVFQWYKTLAGNYQTPIRISQPSFRTLNALASFWSAQLRLSSQDLLTYWYSSEFLTAQSITADHLPCLFLPETYELYWTSTPEVLTHKALASYKKFWNAKRKGQAQALGLNPMEVCILASIVQEESNLRDEQAVIAGVYLNRLKTGMKLQADPTVRFAVGDFSLNRILYTHLGINSPWNTYLNVGLPPGPINIPDRQTIDQTLNAAQHGYIYFCALPDFSGKHAFSSDYGEHLRNAKAYQNALNSLSQTTKP
jgi:UPF0755 protein